MVLCLPYEYMVRLGRVATRRRPSSFGWQALSVVRDGARFRSEDAAKFRTKEGKRERNRERDAILTLRCSFPIALAYQV